MVVVSAGTYNGYTIDGKAVHLEGDGAVTVVGEILVKNVAAMGVYWGSYRSRAPALLAEEFRELFGWFEAGQLKPHVSHKHDLAEAAEAMALLLNRRSTGKVVLTTAAA